MNLYEYGRSNPGTYMDPYGMESIGLDLAKLLLKLPSVEEKVNEAKQGAQEMFLGWPWWAQALTIAFGAGAAYKYYDTGGSISTGNLAIAFGSNLELNLSITVEKAPGGGTGGSAFLGLKITF